jgi:tetratricopeptide (TPR) repeat protein
MLTFQRTLEAAIGYVELGMAGEALHELDSLSPAHQREAPSLELRAVILQQLERWEDAAAIHSELCQAPDASIDRFIGWGCVLYELGRYADCRSALLAAPPSARDHGLWNYHLACYEILLGNREAGRQLIRKALQIEPRLRSMALRNENLRPLIESP